MKAKSYLLIIILGLTLNPIFTWAVENKASGKALGIRELMRNADKYVGKVAVQGIVSRVFPDHKMIAVIDIEEVKECKVITCASLTLPVIWNGDMPKPSDTIQITGKIEKEKNKMVFIAETLKVISEK